MKRDKFEELLQSKLERTEATPPADLWARLESQLPDIRRELVFGAHEDAASGEPLSSPKIRRPMRHKVRWAYVAASVAVCGMMIGVLRNIDTMDTAGPTADNVPPAVSIDNAALPETTEDVPPVVEFNRPVQPASGTVSRIVAAVTTAVSNPGENTGATLADPAQTPLVAANDPGTEPGDPGLQTGTEGDAATQSGTRPDNQTGAEAENRVDDKQVVVTRPTAGYYPAFTPRKRRPTISTSLYAVNSTGTNSPGGNVTSRTKLQKSSLVVKEVFTNPGEETASSTVRSATSNYKLKHDLPLSFGASVNIGLADRLSVETGLTYTYLRSKGEAIHASSNNDDRYVLTQKLHYLGIPVKIKYDFLQTRFLGLYVSGGGSIEKLVSGKINGAAYDDNYKLKPAVNTTEKIKVKSLQGSLGANLGIEFNIDRNDTFGLYLEPGVGYYFENHNQPESYRTENPFNFTIKAGFRVKL